MTAIRDAIPSAGIAQTLASLIGAEHIVLWDADLPIAACVNAAIHMTQTRGAEPHRTPACIVYPTSQAMLAEVITCAATHQWRVLPCGQGSKLAWGGMISGVDVVVSTAKLTQVIDHAIGDLTLTVEAGVQLATIQAQLRQAGQWLALDPTYAQQATLGGIVATADTGALRQRYGGVRDQVIGLTLVRADGQIAKAGGRVVKNVAGYDLMKLMTGSYGTLGILSQLTLRTYPLPEASQTVMLAGDASAIHQATLDARMSVLTPVALDVLSPDLSAALGYPPTMTLIAQFQGIPAGVAEQGRRFIALGEAQGLTAQTVGEADEATVWEQISTHLWSDVEADQVPVICKFGGLPTQVVKGLQALVSTLPQGSWLARCHASSGLGTIRLAAADGDRVAQVRSHFEAMGGFFSVLQAPPTVKTSVDVWGYRGNALGLMQSLKQQFDPQGLLSPGRGD